MNPKVAALSAACFLLLVPSLSLAQSDPEEVVVEEVPTEVAAPTEVWIPDPVVVQPIYASTVSIGGGVHLVSGAGGPIGVPIFEGVTHSVRGMSQGELRLARDTKMATFSWPCDTGTCTGAAFDFWNAMPVQQRQDYLRAQITADQSGPFRNFTRWDVQVRHGSQGEPVECATFSTGDADVTFMPGACPPPPAVTPRR